MKKIGLFYGSTMGDTKEAAQMIADSFKNVEIELHDVTTVTQNDLDSYDDLIFGASTWGLGELQEDWKDFIEQIKKVDFSDKQVALFGLGDQRVYPDTFVDAIGIIYQVAKENGATIIGKVGISDYDFNHSEAVIDDQFVGLPLDNNNQGELTERRIKEWLEELTNKIQ